MSAMFLRFLRRTLVLVVVVAAAILVFRVWDTQRGPPLEPWHTYVPNDLRAAEIDRSDWSAYLKRENTIFGDVRREVVDKVSVETAGPVNRYYAGSAIYPGRFEQDFNRSYILEPDGPPV